jgi:hypothetical protein
MGRGFPAKFVVLPTKKPIFPALRVGFPCKNAIFPLVWLYQNTSGEVDTFLATKSELQIQRQQTPRYKRGGGAQKNHLSKEKWFLYIF